MITFSGDEATCTLTMTVEHAEALAQAYDTLGVERMTDMLHDAVMALRHTSDSTKDARLKANLSVLPEAKRQEIEEMIETEAEKEQEKVSEPKTVAPPKATRAAPKSAKASMKPKAAR